MSKNKSLNVGISEVCDQNGDMVSNNYKSCHISSLRLNRIFFAGVKKYGTVSIYLLTRQLGLVR